MTVDETLEERGKRYGKFSDVAQKTQDLQEAFWEGVEYQKIMTIPAFQSVAVDMILHKLARIAIGDSNYIDNWLDIAGYAQLVVDKLNGHSR